MFPRRPVALVLALVLGAWSNVFADPPAGRQATAQTPAGDPETGRRLFQEYVCYYCHGTEGQGSTRVWGPRIAGMPRSFDSFRSYVRRPAGRMSAYSEASIPDAALVDIYAYLRAQNAPVKAASLMLLEQLRRR